MLSLSGVVHCQNKSVAGWTGSTKFQIHLTTQPTPRWADALVLSKSARAWGPYLLRRTRQAVPWDGDRKWLEMGEVNNPICFEASHDQSGLERSPLDPCDDMWRGEWGVQ